MSGSLSDLEFDVRFNPDIYSEGVTHADPTGARFQKEKKLIKDAARFVIVTQIPTLVSVAYGEGFSQDISWGVGGWQPAFGV